MVTEKLGLHLIRGGLENQYRMPIWQYIVMICRHGDVKNRHI